MLRHEPMAFFEGAAGLSRTSPDWLARQTTVRVASNPHQTKLVGRGVCVSRRGRNRPEDDGTPSQANQPFSGGFTMISIRCLIIVDPNGYAKNPAKPGHPTFRPSWP